MICGITTAPRPKQANYLKETVQSLINAGGDRVFVFAEPGTDLGSLKGLPVRVALRQKRLGNWRNWRLMSKSLLAISETEDILTCEDDVLFCKDAISIAQRYLHASRGNDAGPLLVYTSSVHQRQILGEVGVIRGPNLTGSCAIAWPREALRRVIECDIAKNWRGIDNQEIDEEIRHGDLAIGACCHNLGLRVLAMRPCLAQHVGLVSSVHVESDHPDLFAESILDDLV